MNIISVYQFLNELKDNNTRDWFKSNESKYKKAKKEFMTLVEKLISGINEFDSKIGMLSPKDCMFRINRDIRFSKNKDPYKTNFGAVIAKGGRKSPYAGYYIHIEPEGSFIGGGIYMPEPKVLKAIREEIFNNPEQFKNIINDNIFKQYFNGIYGEKLKSAPRGFDKDFEYLDLIKHKHYAVVHNLKDDELLKNNSIEPILNIFKAQFNFNNYLNRIIEKLD